MDSDEDTEGQEASATPQVIEPMYRTVALSPETHHKVYVWAQHRDWTMGQAVDWAFDNLGVPMEDDHLERMADTVDLKRKYEKENPIPRKAGKSYLAVIEAALKLSELVIEQPPNRCTQAVWDAIGEYKYAVSKFN